MANVTAPAAQDVYALLETTPQGLDGEEARRRLQKYGFNEIPRSVSYSWIKLLVRNFVHMLAVILWVAGGLAFIGGMPQLGWAIIAVIFINAFFSFAQEWRAYQAVEALQRLIEVKARVLRDGTKTVIPAREVVPGDVLLLEAGDQVVADARLVESYGLEVINASLTGESTPVFRTAEPDPGVRNLLYARNLVFAGTSVAAGTGRAVVFRTGPATELGRIARMTREVRHEPSPLQRQLERAVKVIAALAFGAGVVFVLLGLALGRSLHETVLLAIGLIAANVPEGLLPTVTLSLALAVRSMARVNALIKQLASAQTLGSVTVICTDKTGTLTENKMLVTRIWAGGESYSVTGNGYEPRGEIVAATGPLAPPGAGERLGLLLRAAALCNNAHLVPPPGPGGEWSVVGDPTEAALLAAAGKAGLSPEALGKEYPRAYELAFDTQRKRMSTVHRVGNRYCVFTKGAPGSVLGCCSGIWWQGMTRPLSAARKEEVMKQFEQMAREGLRVLGVAYRELPQLPETLTQETLETDLIFLGLVAMMDTPRQDVPDAVRKARSAGIRIIIVTGDYGATALAVARMVGVVTSDRPRLVSGEEIDAMTDEAFLQALSEPEVILYRTTPEHKLRAVQLLQRNGEIVAVTGDGVNDAPALTAAHIGVAMGKGGTDVAREAADVVLLQDSFSSIVHGIEWGRAIFDNVRKFLIYIFAHLTPEAIPYVLYSFLPIPVPLTIMQILAIDLGTETIPALALGAEKPEPHIMERPPRPPQERLLNFSVLARGYLFLGIINAFVVLFAFFWTLRQGGWEWGTVLPLSDPLARKAATMTFAGIVMMQVGNVFACRTEETSLFRIGVLGNRLIIWGVLFELVFTCLLIYIPACQPLFGTAPLGWRDWLLFLPFIPLPVLAEEARKALVRRIKRK